MNKTEELKGKTAQIIKDCLSKQFAKGATKDGTYIYYSKPIATQILKVCKEAGLKFVTPFTDENKNGRLDIEEIEID